MKRDRGDRFKVVRLKNLAISLALARHWELSKLNPSNKSGKALALPAPLPPRSLIKRTNVDPKQK